ncbi:MAG: phosphoribosylformylglycinamidine cyclo-ligase [Herbinix sp.]|jgi:phosphoribosylformylglycinamidine cyclo-ligase|nr:phosphoribosylformylglycinamidine cyclo-ligase [Herbinix sp.]
MDGYTRFRIDYNLGYFAGLGGFYMDYKKAGVDIEAGYKAVDLMKEHIKGTMRKEVLSDIGGFSGAFSLLSFKNMEQPTLVSGTDGVGTKLKIAFLLDKHDTIGIDCVAMCVNDIACAGAEPLFFLDYIACGKNEPEKIATIVKGVAEGCKQANAALIGGETAEMPGFYPEDEYDLAGFAVGIVDQKKLITGASLKAGDTLIGIASSGIHSNGYSLVRKVFRMQRETLDTYYESLSSTLGETLLTPTKIYVKALQGLKNGNVTVKACSHITGGGFYENIPRMLPEGIHARIIKNSYDIPPVFQMLSKDGDIEEQMMYNTYNMGLGMMIAVDNKEADTAIRLLKEAGEKAYIVGETVQGEKGVSLC